ncbi:hypothetical protein [Longimicrobium sp.]|uniref:hypothetical protein n=1 Tax=Longimicrobium sp. TaxID=2029185 RepID=UPI002E34F2DF|nr:hypothetical protein [Longimicrobium sp.]HEX6037227.1 hypothetical protein [Longimicrobium sp.]
METIVIPLQDRRVRLAERMDLLGHVAAAVGLGAAASDSFSTRPLLSVLEIVLALALAFAVAREVRHTDSDDEESARVSWLNLVAAAVLLTEWYVERSAGGKLFSPELLSAIVAVGLAFLHPLIQYRRRARRSLRMDDTHLTLTLGRFRRYSFAWAELAGVETTPDGLRFRTVDGTETPVPMRAVINRDQIQDVIVSWARRMSGAGQTVVGSRSAQPADAS